MKTFKIFLLVGFLALVSFVGVHKYYVSVTNVVYAPKTQSVQIISRVFIDDMNSVLEERYGVQAKLGTPKESALAVDYVEKYLRTKFVVVINDQRASYQIVATKYDSDMLLMYLEIENVKEETLAKIEVYNEVLTDLYEEQQNMVHIRVKDTKKSFVLTKSDAKGMLNL